MKTSGVVALTVVGLLLAGGVVFVLTRKNIKSYSSDNRNDKDRAKMLVGITSAPTEIKQQTYDAIDTMSDDEASVIYLMVYQMLYQPNEPVDPEFQQKAQAICDKYQIFQG